MLFKSKRSASNAIRHVQGKRIDRAIKTRWTWKGRRYFVPNSYL